MSCLLQRPSVSFHYSESPLPSAPGGLVMNSPNSTSRLHESRESTGMEQFSESKGPQCNNMPGHIGTVNYPQVYLSCDTSGSINDKDGFDSGLKNEAYFPQPNSPVEYFNGEHSDHNGFKQASTPIFNFTEAPNMYRENRSIPVQLCHPNARTGDSFSLNLKLELENYVHSCETGEQFRKFRDPISPASSLSCSTSSLVSLVPPMGTTRRHSFSATAQSAESSTVLPTLLGPGSIHVSSGGCESTNSNSYYRQRSQTYSSSSTKTHSYPLVKRPAGWQSSISSQNDLHARIEGLQIRHDVSNDEHKDDSSNLAMDQDYDGNERSCETSRDVSRKGSIDDAKAFDPINFLFLGPFGKKRKMVHERKQSLEGTETGLLHPIPMDDQSSPDANVLSPVGSDFGNHKDKVEDIVEEDEFEETAGVEINYEESNEPLNLCLGEEAETMERVSKSNLNNSGSMYSSQSSLASGMRSRAMSGGNLLSPPDGSVLRRQLLGLTESIGPTPPQYQTRDRSASMSVITLRNRLSVIQETRAALNPRRTLSPPPSGQRQSNGFLHPSNATSTLSINSSTSDTSVTKRSLTCQDCGKVFSQLRNYRYHRSRHEGTSQFACVCPVCHKQFNDRGYLSSHLKIHKNAKEYQCEFCEKSFNQRVAYNMHVRIHTGVKPHQCVKCDKAFSRRMLLKQHERTHTGERPYKCEICGKAFADRSNMLLHQRLHTGLRPFHCDVCGKSFSKNHHLKTHLNHHAGIKPYQCSKCNATFSQSSNMKTHFRKCTAVPMDENNDLIGSGNQERGGKAVKAMSNKNNTAPIHLPQKPYNFQFDDRQHQLAQGDSYDNVSESPRSSNAFLHRPDITERLGINNLGFAGYRFSPQNRSTSPSDGLSASANQLSTSAPSSSIHASFVQHHASSGGELMYLPDDSRSHHLPPHSQAVNFDPGQVRRNSLVQYSTTVESPPKMDGSSQHFSSNQSSTQSQRIFNNDLQKPFTQLDYSTQHHIQQSLQHLQLSPQNLHQSAIRQDEGGRVRANTWSTNTPGRCGVGKRKQPL